MSSSDQIQHFLFTNADIRGQLVGLEESYRQAIENHNYPKSIEKLIGEFMAAAALLGSTLKIDGTISIQAQGTGSLTLIMAECKSNREIRAVARYQGECNSSAINELLGIGQLAITIDPEQGQRYQGIVPLENATLAKCLEAYFDQSEQLKTRIWLAGNSGEQVSGLLLQAMPSAISPTDSDAWPRICTLTDTLSESELEKLQNIQLLYRLYHEEEVELYPPHEVNFSCSCNRDRIINALVSLGAQEVEEMFTEEPLVEINCEFCNQSYTVAKEEVEPYLMELDISEIASDLAPSRTLH